MTKSINKQFKFVYIRDDRYDRSFDGNDFSEIRAKHPKFVVGNKQPSHLYYKGVRANEFMQIYMSDYSTNHQKSFNEAEWTKQILKFCKKTVSEMRKDIRLCERNSDTTSYFRKVRDMLIPVYKEEIKLWKQREKVLTNNGTYTYLELTK